MDGPGSPVCRGHELLDGSHDPGEDSVRGPQRLWCLLTASPREEPHLKSLTAARYVAAIAVVLYHFGHEDVAHAPLVLKNFFHLGFTGVGFFFVLSGFVLTYIYGPRAGTFRRTDFFVARFARIYPVYFLSFLLAVLPWAINAVQHRPVLPDLAVKIPAYALMLQAWLPWYDNVLNGAAWTLSVEMLFYLLFPFLLPFFVGWDRRWALTGLLVMAVIALVAPALAVASGATPATTGFYGNLWRFFPLIHLPAFLCGIFLARLYQLDREEQRYRRWVLPTGLIVFLAVVAMNRTVFYYFLHDGALLLPFSAIIYGLAAREGILGRAHVPRGLILLGDASYGIYILQFPIYGWSSSLLKRFHVGIDVDQPAGLIGYVLYLSAICVLIYYYCESPARIRLRGMMRGIGARKPRQQT